MSALRGAKRQAMASAQVIVVLLLIMMAPLAAADADNVGAFTTGNSQYVATGAPTCVWFEGVQGGGNCDAQLCDDSTEYARALLTPVTDPTADQVSA